jgi:hypothetical protein
VKGKKYLLFGGGFGRPGGVWMVTQDEPRTLVIAGATLRQCAVVESLGMIFMLLGKVGCFSQSFIRQIANISTEFLRIQIRRSCLTWSAKFGPNPGDYPLECLLLPSGLPPLSAPLGHYH